MNDIVYWDTSALLKVYAAEADSSDYLQLLISQPGDIAISYLHRVELYYALCGKESRGKSWLEAQRLYLKRLNHILPLNDIGKYRGFGCLGAGAFSFKC